VRFPRATQQGNFSGIACRIKAIYGKQKNQKPEKENQKESKTQNESGGPITAPSAKIAPTTVQSSVALRMAHYR